MISGILKYKTSSGRIIMITYSFEAVFPFEIKTDKERFSKMCKSDCKNYDKKWSCPPSSPRFDSMKHKKYFNVIMLRIDGKDFSDCSEWSKVKAINSILKPLTDKIVKKIETKYNGYAYTSGACRLCKKCAKISNEPCRKPDKLRYSLESVGIDCNELVKNILKTKLCWYQKGKKYEYGSSIGAVETDEKIDKKVLIDEFNSFSLV